MYTLEFAKHLAHLWRNGKLIGGDPYKVVEALSNEVDRLHVALSGLLEYCAESNPMQGDVERDDPRVKAAMEVARGSPVRPQ